MAQVLTYKQIIDVLQDIAGRSEFLKSFGYGPIWDMEAHQGLNTPTLWVKPIAGKLVRSQEAGFYPVKNLVLELICVDLVESSKVNVNDVKSDTFQILTDIVSEINGNPYYQQSSIILEGDVNLIPLEDFEDDASSGWKCEITFKLQNPYDFCGLPLTPITNFAFPGPGYSGLTYTTNFLTCDTITGCTTFQNYVAQHSSTAQSTFLQNGLNTYTGGTSSLPSINVTGLTINNINSSGQSTFNNILVNSGYTIYSNDGGGQIALDWQGNPDSVAITNDGGVGLNSSLILDDQAFSLTTYSGTTFPNNYAIIEGQSSTSQTIEISVSDNRNYPSVNYHSNNILMTVNNTGSSNNTLFTENSVKFDKDTYLANTSGKIYSANTDLGTIIQRFIPLSGTSGNLFSASTGSTSIIANRVGNLAGNYAVALGKNNQSNGDGSLIGGGESNLIYPTARYGIILGGSGNTIYNVGAQPQQNLHSYNFIANGNFNLINDWTSFGTILNGSGNTINSGRHFSTIIGGARNTISGTSSGSTIVAGQDNIITGKYSSILAGTGLTNSFDETAISKHIGALGNLSGATIYSGNTDLSLLFMSINAPTGGVQAVEGGFNIVTGGTSSIPTISTVTNPVFISLSAGTLSGGTIYSGTIYSGSSELSTIFQLQANATRINQGTNITTGGTAINPTINTVSSPLFSTVTAINISGGTISGGTIYSGSTNISSLFALQGTQTVVSQGTNITTGGTVNNPIINTVANPLFNVLTAVNISGGTLSANTYYSASTLISDIFVQRANQTRVSQGTNITTGGTPNLPTINVVASPSFTNLTATTYSINPITSGITTSTYNTDLSTSSIFLINLSANTTWSYTNGRVGLYNFIFFQDSTGGRTLSYAASSFSTPSGNTITMSTGANQVDMISAIFDPVNSRLMLINAQNFQTI